jgi:hypothetical protein
MILNNVTEAHLTGIGSITTSNNLMTIMNMKN